MIIISLQNITSVCATNLFLCSKRTEWNGILIWVVSLNKLDINSGKRGLLLCSLNYWLSSQCTHNLHIRFALLLSVKYILTWKQKWLKRLITTLLLLLSCYLTCFTDCDCARTSVDPYSLSRHVTLNETSDCETLNVGWRVKKTRHWAESALFTFLSADGETEGKRGNNEGSRKHRVSFYLQLFQLEQTGDRRLYQG